jgi:PIN domain nuclease of toxin-antitoxin system
MNRYVTDTQCILWYLAKDRHLPRAAHSVFHAASEGRAQILIPSITLVETIFLIQRQRVSEDLIVRLLEFTEDAREDFYIVPLDVAVVHAMRDFGPAAIPEMPDRIIAATARALDLPLLTVDHVIIKSKLVKVLE